MCMEVDPEVGCASGCICAFARVCAFVCGCASGDKTVVACCAMLLALHGDELLSSGLPLRYLPEFLEGLTMIASSEHSSGVFGT